MEKDERFKNVINDPKFRRIPKTERKVKIDQRFKSMFKDKNFKVKYTIDKRGRPLNTTSNEDLKKYYDLSSDDESDSKESDSGDDDEQPDDVKQKETTKTPKQKPKKVSKLPNKIKKKLKDLSVDYARGEGKLESDSSSDDESETEESEDDLEHNWGEMDRDADTTEEITNRLAICNMDWDRIRASDLMVLFNSFLPTSSLIKSITIYPSEFGLKRMKEEEINGPSELTENKDVDDLDEEETEEGSKYHMEKLRQYQLNRLKYYYGIVVCDSPETANKLYTECDGLEYESSANKIDLRFVPDDTTFDHEPKEVCDKLPEMSRYMPRFFMTSALQQAKVDLTWDETNPDRLEIAKKLEDGKIDDVCDADLQNYLASSSGEESESENDDKVSEDEDTKNPIDKYRSLLQDIEKAEDDKKNKGVEMEVTWGLNLKEKTEKLVRKKLAETEEKTPFQQLMDKKKEKKKLRRAEKKNKATADESDASDIPSDIDMNDPYFAEEFNNADFKKKKVKKADVSDDEIDDSKNAELELLLLDEDDDNKNHFNMKKIQDEQSTKKSKRKMKKRDEAPKKEDDFEINVKDDRFSALFTSHHYNIDPTDPHYRKTKAMTALIEEKLKRRADQDLPTEPKKVKRKNAELSALVKSVKRKAQAMKVRK